MARSAIRRLVRGLLAGVTVRRGRLPLSASRAMLESMMHIRIQGEQQTLCGTDGISMEITRSDFGVHPDRSPFGPQVLEENRRSECIRIWRERPFLPK